MNVFIGNGHIIAGNRIYCCWYDPEQKDGAEKMAYFHSCRYCSGSDQRIFIYLYDLAFVRYPDPGTGNRALF